MRERAGSLGVRSTCLQVSSNLALPNIMSINLFVPQFLYLKDEDIDSRCLYLKSLQEALIRSILLERASKYNRRLALVVCGGKLRTSTIVGAGQAGEGGEGANHRDEE